MGKTMTSVKQQEQLQTLLVELGSRSYSIHIGEKLLGEAGGWLKQIGTNHRAIIVTDENVGQFYLHRLTGALATAGINSASIVLPAGEQAKCWTQLDALIGKIMEQSPDRATMVIALGGGVIGDLAGVAASLVLRGLPFIQMPTTLLAQVDSSVGGKTGINTVYGKNTLGAFYQPKMVLIDTSTLKTLPKRQLLAGYAEVIKYGLIYDAEFFDWLLANGSAVVAGDEDALRHAIAVSCQTKAVIVAEDETEQGKRAWLNFGHTYAHAFERELDYSDDLLHGEAVAIGMVMALKLSAKLGHTDATAAEQLEDHLTTIGLRTSPKQVREMWNVDALMQHMTRDKKAQAGKLTFVLAKAISEVFIAKDVDASIVRNVIAEELS